MTGCGAPLSVTFERVALAFRIVNGWQVTIAGRVVPMWASVVGIVVPAALAALVWQEQRRP